MSFVLLTRNPDSHAAWMRLKLLHRLPFLYANDDKLEWFFTPDTAHLHIQVTEDREPGPDGMIEQTVTIVPRTEIEEWCECNSSDVELWRGTHA